LRRAKLDGPPIGQLLDPSDPYEECLEEHGIFYRSLIGKRSQSFNNGWWSRPVGSETGSEAGKPLVANQGSDHSTTRVGRSPHEPDVADPMAVYAVAGGVCASVARVARRSGAVAQRVLNAWHMRRRSSCF